MTYRVEAAPLLSVVFALRLFPDGSATEQMDILALADNTVCPDDLWKLLFVPWAPAAITTAGSVATRTAERIGAAAAVAYQGRLEREFGSGARVVCPASQ